VKQGLTWTLCAALLISTFCGDALALVPATSLPPRSARVRTRIAALGSGPEALVAVRLADRSVVSGYVGETGPESFLVVDPATGTGKTVEYAQVVRLHGQNLVSGAEVQDGGGIRTKVLGALAVLLPARPAPVNHFSATKTLIVGIAIGIVLAVVLAKTV
jgi:hypothetical protein